MYKTAIISSNIRVIGSIAACSIWSERSDFEYIGSIADESYAIGFLKETGSSMVFIDAAGRNPLDMPVISHIQRTLPQVYIVLISEDNSFNMVRNGFIAGIFDYLVTPITEASLETVMLRLYSDLGSRYITAELSEPLNSLITTICEGGEDVSALCEGITEKIFSAFSSDIITAFTVLAKTKAYVYDEIVSKIPWLKNFVYKDNFDYSVNAVVQDEYLARQQWCTHIREIVDTIQRYSFLDDSLITGIGYYVINHVDDRLSLDDVSSGVYLNKSYISHIFKKVSGISFVNFITEVKTERAKILLKNPRLKIYQIATQIGYNNPEYFSRVFKGVTGLTPNQYRYDCCKMAVSGE